MEEADRKLLRRIELGRNLKARTIRSREELGLAESEQERWEAYNTDLLRSILDPPDLAEKIACDGQKAGLSFPDLLDAFRADIEIKINRLVSIRERLEIMSGASTATSFDPESVFLVHGHDAVREAVARFLEKLKLKVIILGEQASRGRTIIEQFEQCSAIGFAVILLTPDDLGSTASAPNSLRPRARQNVIFELGYFCGSVGRANVCALYKGALELPSDLHGILYVPLDEAGAWRTRLFKELEAAGMKVSSINLP